MPYRGRRRRGAGRCAVAELRPVRRGAGARAATVQSQQGPCDIVAATHAGLEYLGLERTGLGDAGALALTPLLRNSGRLSVLDLEHNLLTQVAAVALRDAVLSSTASVLTKLKLKVPPAATRK